jgi:hypothetical protein
MTMKRTTTASQKLHEIDKELSSDQFKTGVHPSDGNQRQGNRFGFRADIWNLQDDRTLEVIEELGEISIDVFGVKKLDSPESIPAALRSIASEIHQKLNAAAEWAEAKLGSSQGRPAGHMVDHLTRRERARAERVASQIAEIVNSVAGATICHCCGPLIFSEADLIHGLDDLLKFGIEIRIGQLDGCSDGPVIDFRHDPFSQAAKIVEKTLGCLPEAARRLREIAA